MRPDGTHFGKAATNEIAGLLAAVGNDFQQPGPQAGQDRRMMGEHGEVAFRARHDDLLDIGRDEQPLRRHEIEFEGIGHRLRSLGRELLGLLDGLLDGADHVEGSLGEMVIGALAESLKGLNGVGEIDEFAGRAGEHFGHMEGLR